jgi:glucokinase
MKKREPDRIIAAVDIGGTSVRIALATPLGEVLAKDRFPCRSPQSPEELVERVVVNLSRLAAGIGVDLREISALGCSVPGPLDRILGIVQFSPHLGWRDVPLAALFSGRLPLPFTMDDDANCAALGEARLGAAQSVPCMVYVTVSTGIGAGIVIDGHIYRGSHGLAGEVGHVPLEPAGPRCACGNTGCFEALASGSAMAELARATVHSGVETSLRGIVASPDLLTAEHVIAAADDGDIAATQIVERTARYLGAGLAMVASAFDPEMIVLGGGVMQPGNGLLERARAQFASLAIAPIGELVAIAPASLGDDSALVGAALLAADLAGVPSSFGAVTGKGEAHVR